MTGAEVIAIVSVSVGGLVTLLSTCFHSRCTTIDCWGVHCKRKLLDEEEQDETPLDTFEKNNNLIINPEIKKILHSSI
tara:strand:- start:2106 stop:2339 length:234 start_codon:yes stop_codon:yes gene_type:complete